LTLAARIPTIFFAMTKSAAKAAADETAIDRDLTVIVMRDTDVSDYDAVRAYAAALHGRNDRGRAVAFS
jgi:hypothetical protein